MNRRNFMKAAVGASALAAIPIVASAKQPELLFTIDEEYKRSKWVEIMAGGQPKRGGIVAISCEAYIAIHSGRMKFQMPKGHIVDIWNDLEKDLLLVKLWGDDLPIVREGEVYPRLKLILTR